MRHFIYYIVIPTPIADIRIPTRKPDEINNSVAIKISEHARILKGLIRRFWEIASDISGTKMARTAFKNIAVSSRNGDTHPTVMKSNNIRPAIAIHIGDRSDLRTRNPS
ncbi:MAG: hypothetical protein AABY83_00300, partial [Pseudomonadota bacterium]